MAITLLVLSGVLLILGIGQRTFLAGPDEIVYSYAGVEADGDYAVLDAPELEAVPGDVELVIEGENAFAARGAAIDVEAWVSAFPHATLRADSGGARLVSEDPVAADPETAEDAQGADPRGSDLWRSEQVGPGRMPVTLEQNESIIVATGAGTGVSLAWAQDRRTPWAGPLLAAGALFAIAGLVLYLLAVDHDRRGLGPRRGRRGPLLGLRNMFGRRRRTRSGSAASSARSGNGARAGRRALPVLGIGLALALTGCSPSYWPDFSAEEAATDAPTGTGETTTAAPVPVTPEQLDRIVGEIVAAAGTADDELDAKLLEARFTGDALAQRSANYEIRESVDSYDAPPRLTDEALDYELVQSTEGWPRTAFVTVESLTPAGTEEDEDGSEDGGGSEAVRADAVQESIASPSLALVMTQETPHSNYLVSRVIALRGGITMPTAAPAEEGTALLADDLQTLLLPPGEVGGAYARILAGETDTEEAALFDLTDDTIIEKSGAAWVASAEDAADEDDQDVRYSVKTAQAETPNVSLSTGTGGALVTTTVIEERVERAGEGWKPKAVGAVSALSGLEGQQDRIVSEVAHQLLFYVPSNTGDQRIQLLGYTTELVGARK
nr:glycosyltransferase [Leucobacter weissii]